MRHRVRQLALAEHRAPHAEPLEARLLAGGAGVPHHAVGVVGGARPTLVRTDAAGRATIALPSAGRWLLRATVLRRAGDAALDWESEFATLSVAVGVR